MNVAFIPVRGGSKSIPKKNIKYIAGKPLVYWVLAAASKSQSIDKIYVSSDSEEIRSTVTSFNLNKVNVMERSVQSSTDFATTELAILEFIQKYDDDYENIALIQATSPLLTENDIDNGFHLMEQGVDSILSVVKQKRFIWKVDEGGFAKATNYDIFNRPRRQDFEGSYIENGALYITKKEQLLQSGNRISGNIKLLEMHENSFLELDEQEDWIIIENLLRKQIISELIKKDIKLFLCDCDGVLTDGGMYYDGSGEVLKKFNTLDGMAFQLLNQKGIKTGVITGENSLSVEKRADKMGADYLELGCKNKLEKIKELCNKQNITLQNVAYVGDDVNDYNAVASVGFGCGVLNCNKRLKSVAQYITTTRGGEGAVREVADLILEGMQ